MTRASDARHAATRLIRAAREAAPDQPVLAFGALQGAWVGFGERDSFRVGDGSWELRHLGAVVDSGPDGPGIWKRVDEFLGAVAGQPVIGFLGFDLHRGAETRLQPARRLSTYLAVPEALARVDAKGSVAMEGGPGLEPGPWEAMAAGDPGTGDVPAPSVEPTVRKAELPADLASAFEADVARALTWIGGRDEARVTLATRVPVEFDVDLPASLAAPLPEGQPSVLSRSFYASVDGLELVGTSPELLAAGSTSSFRTYKLSGTYPLPQDHRAGDWRNDLMDDERVQREHELSVAALMEGLRALGTALRGPRQIVELEGLAHLMTPATTRPGPGATPFDCITSVFPSGVWPFPDGLSVVADVEQQGRGPYYGLFGLIEASGAFEWTQLLRAAFQDGLPALGRRSGPGACWIPVGAAVTSHSSPELEAQEIQLKLRTVHLREREPEPDGGWHG